MDRTLARPPQVVRRPRIVPLSRLMGATPTKAAICFFADFPKLWDGGHERLSKNMANAIHTLQQLGLCP